MNGFQTDPGSAPHIAQNYFPQGIARLISRSVATSRWGLRIMSVILEFWAMQFDQVFG
jgi:hypothetical protein